MKRALLRIQPISLGAILVSTTLACARAPSAGGSSAASATSPSVGENAAERCLAAAGAKRERKPTEPARITAKHVLVRFAGAKRAPETITRTREQACLRAEEALTKLHEGLSFGEVVRVYSDEAGAATREGTIGAIERTDVAAAFADAAFELNTGEVSQVVETDFGFHLILRIE